MENIINNPGLHHLAENIFLNLGPKDLEECRLINKTSTQILDNPMFWLRKFGQGSLSKKNREEWIKTIKLHKNSDMEKKILLILKWSLENYGLVDLLLYTNPIVQDDFKKRIKKAAKLGHIKTVQILAPLTDNPNTPLKYGETPIYSAALFGQTEIVKILAPLADNPNAPNKYGNSPIHLAAQKGTEIVNIYWLI